MFRGTPILLVLYVEEKRFESIFYKILPYEESSNKCAHDGYVLTL